MRRIIVNVLTQLGISTDYISEAEDGLVALGKVKTNSYDVILTDWNMPRMNGLQFVQNIRKLPKYSHTPILMITTEGGKSEVIEALKNGVNNYIVKPFNADVLKGKLEPILNRHKKK
jgi:two-component system chemotaxis response regulator CheY